jgi:hypothetical protein
MAAACNSTLGRLPAGFTCRALLSPSSACEIVDLAASKRQWTVVKEVTNAMPDMDFFLDPLPPLQAAMPLQAFLADLQHEQPSPGGPAGPVGSAVGGASEPLQHVGREERPEPVFYDCRGDAFPVSSAQSVGSPAGSTARVRPAAHVVLTVHESADDSAGAPSGALQCSTCGRWLQGMWEATRSAALSVASKLSSRAGQ